MKHTNTVGQLRIFLDKYDSDERVTFLVDGCLRVKIDETYGDKKPIITLMTEVEPLIAQDAALPWDDEGPGAA